MYQSVTPLTNAYQQQASQFGPSVDAIANQMRRPKISPGMMGTMNQQAALSGNYGVPNDMRPYQTDPMEMGLANAQNALGQQELQGAYQNANNALGAAELANAYQGASDQLGSGQRINPAQDAAMKAMYSQRPPQDAARIDAQAGRISPQVQAIMNARKQPQGMARQAPPQQITPIQNAQY